MASYTVEARFDEEAGVWYVSKSDVPGLATEAATVEALLAKLRIMIPELLECNGALENEADADVPFELIAYRQTSALAAVA